MKKLMMMVAGASALALTASAEARNWFNANISSYAAESAFELTQTGGSWDNDANSKASVTTAGQLDVDTALGEELAFTATNSKDLANGTDSVTITSLIKFNAFASVPEAPEGAKAAIIVVGNATDGYNYYGLGSDGEGNAAFVMLDGIPDLENFVSIEIVVEKGEGGNKITYKATDFSLGTTEVPATDNTISEAGYSGTGSVQSLSAVEEPSAPPTYTFTLAAVTGIESFVVSNADNTAEIAYDNGYTVEQGAAVNIYAIPAAGKFVSPASVQKVISADGAIDLADDLQIEDGKVKKGSVYFLTLQDALNDSASGAITLCDDIMIDSAVTLAKAEALELDGYTLTFGNFAQTLDYDFVITNAKTTGGVLNKAQIAVGAVLDLSALTWGAGGLLPDESTPTAAFSISNGGWLKMGADAVAPDQYAAGFITPADQAKYTANSVDYTYFDAYSNWFTGIPTVVPTAAQNLVYDGTEKTGVAAAAGYTVTDGAKTAAGKYTAAVTLVAGYQWTDGTFADKNIDWSIAAATVTPVVVFDPADTIVEYSADPATTFPAVTIAGDYVKDTDYTVGEWSGSITEPAPGATNEYTVTVTMQGNYIGTGTATFKVFKTGAAPADDWPENPETVAGKKAGDMFPGVPAALEDVDAGTLATWAKAEEVAFSDKADIKVNAFLLDCANTDDAIAEEQAKFKVSIAIVEGIVTVTPANGDTYKNGKIALQGRVSLTEGDWAAYDSATHKFVRAMLVPATVEAK